VRYGRRVSPIPVDDAAALAVLRSPLFAGTTKRFWEWEHGRYRVKLRVREGAPPAVLDRLEDEARAIRTGKARLTGLYVRAVGTARRLVSDLVRGALLMTLVTLATVGVALRSVRLAAAALLPNLLPVALVFGGAALAGIPFDVSVVAVGAVAVGLAVDDTLHVLFRFARERRAGRGVDAAILAAQAAVGRALVSSTVVLVAGLGCLALSAFLPTARFGLFTALACALALPGDVVLLPALLRMLHRNEPPAAEAAS
jgi:predicted RND superfamily exporter protein